MASALPRLAALLAGALVVLGGTGASAAPELVAAHVYSASPGGSAAPGLQTARLAQLAATFRGGPITTSTGAVVNVLVSDSLPEETPEKWAEFVAGLTHGPELTRLVSTTIATLAEVQAVCGGQALGCYGGNRMISHGELLVDDVTAEEVVRHEYGHHVANHRSNSPWPAGDWGPKQWASAASVCAKVAREEAFPGDGGQNYTRNPAEAWAEVFRLMDERKAGITTARWQIVGPSFYPNEAALVAAERDVLQPWVKRSTRTLKRTFGRRTKVWWIPLATPLDGELRLSATLPREGEHEVALVSGNRRTVVKRAQWVGQRVKRTTTTVCGQRTHFVRVTQKGAFGRVAVTVTTP
jgi:hypothetical protein